MPDGGLLLLYFVTIASIEIPLDFKREGALRPTTPVLDEICSKECHSFLQLKEWKLNANEQGQMEISLGKEKRKKIQLK